jgi:hypothetical protein
VKEIKFKNITTTGATSMETEQEQKIAKERLFGLSANAPTKN